MRNVIFIPCDEADDPGLRGKNIKNSHMGELPKSVVLHCVLFEICQEARKDCWYLYNAIVHSRF